MAFTNNYTLGRGEVYFARRDPVTGLLGGERYIGNTPEFNVTAEEEKLEHFSSDRGIRVKDATVTLQVNYTGTIQCDNIDRENIALFFLGESSTFTVSGATVTAEQVGATGVGVVKGMYYQLGATALNPSGHRNIVFPGDSATTFSLKKSSTTLVAGVDYIVNAALGRVEILETSTTITNGDVLTAAYTVLASARERVISGSTAIEGQLRYISYNPRGSQRDFLMPSATLSPNGDLPLKADEWQVIPFNVEITKKDDQTPAIIADGRALSS